MRYITHFNCIIIHLEFQIVETVQIMLMMWHITIQTWHLAPR